MLRLMRHCKWLRRMPHWHSREQAFRDWYISLLEKLDLSSDTGYETALKVLRSPEAVSGYREVRYPKLDAAKATAEAELLAPKSQAPAASMATAG